MTQICNIMLLVCKIIVIYSRIALISGRKRRYVVSTTCLTQNWSMAIKVYVRLPDQLNFMSEV